MYFHLDIGIKYPLGIFFSMSLYYIEINWRHELNGLSSAELRYASIYRCFYNGNIHLYKKRFSIDTFYFRLTQQFVNCFNIVR